MPVGKLKIVYRRIAALTPYENNTRTHTPEQMEALRLSIREFGFTNPVLLKDDVTIGAGHARCLAAEAEGIDEVPTITLRGLSDAQWRAYVIADNRLAEKGSGWDLGKLELELTSLNSEGFDISLAGFAGFSLDSLRLELAADGGRGPDAGSGNEGPPAPEDAPEPPVNPVSRTGDVWRCGDHRVMCGNGLDPADLATLLRGLIPDLAYFDPPYGISVVKGAKGGSVGARGKVHGVGRSGFREPSAGGRAHGPAKRAVIKRGVYATIVGDDTTDTAVGSYEVARSLGIPLIILWGGNYYADRLPASRCWIVWDKENTGSFADVELAWTNKDAVARIFHHEWNGLMKASERGQRRVHPTQKPVALAEWVIENIAPGAASVVDLFLGSASTLIAAERRKLLCFGMEIAPAYVDVAVHRWEAYTGAKAILDATGQTFVEVAGERLAKLEADPSVLVSGKELEARLLPPGPGRRPAAKLTPGGKRPS